MLNYQARLAWRSLRRNPFLSAVIIGGIALGIAVSMTFVTAYYRLAGNPIPHKSDRLFYVQMDAWDPERPWDDDDPSEPPDQLTYTDMVGIMKSDIPTLQTGMYKAELTIHPEDEHLKPYREQVRMCFADFFGLFEPPFAYGAGWDRNADRDLEPVIVIDSETNQKLFGGENSVGRKLRIEDREFTIVGVLARWRPMPKYYDTMNSELGEPEAIFMPFPFGPDLEAYSSGNTNGWKSRDGREYEDFLASESVWIQMWVQLDNDRQREEYMAFLNAYAGEQKKLGRFGRPINNKLRDVMAWLHFEEVVPDEARALTIISLLFLLVCSVNLIGILLGKFLARASEVGVRRALGASRRWVFFQHLIECEMIGVMGGVVGLVLAAGGLRLIDRLFDSQLNFRFDLNMYLVTLALALVSALIAGMYPAWRICRIEPGVHLKTQ